MSSKQYKVLELRHALKKLIALQSTNFSDSEKMEVAGLYSKWKSDTAYSVGDVVKYGYNEDGETQLYEILQAHTSSIEWLPNATSAIYRAIGFDEESSYPIWTQPLGAIDAYNLGDRVYYNGYIYESLINGNVWSPESYSAGWENLGASGPTV